jgi:predicted permease
MAEIGPLTGNDWGMTIKVDGYTPKENEDLNPSVDAVGPGYFSTLGVPLIAGREFSPADGATAPRVAVINETLAHYFFGSTNPIGRRFGFGRDGATDIEIVGVVKDIRSQSLRKEPVRFVYIPYTQDRSLGSLTFYLRAATAASPAAAIREAVQRVDPSLPMYDMKTMSTQVEESLFVDRMVAALSVAFGALATLLAAIGLYGVISYAVARRTREIGIRMALGAERNGVMWLVLREAAVLAGAGIGAGVVAALLLVRYVQSQLYGLSATDPRTMFVAACVLAFIALLAGYVPARRATGIDPILALRTE